MKERLFHCALAISLGLALAALLLWLGAAAPVQADPDTRYVAPPPAGSDGGNNCTDPGNPCATLQHAIDVADPGDEIHVTAGTYTSAVGTVAVITKALVIVGGFAPDFSVHDPDMHQTELDAQWGGSVISITNADDVLLMHLTLIHGDGTGNCGYGWGCGGGIYARGTGLHVGHCVITDNVGSTSAWAMGGGVYVYNYNFNNHTDMWESRVVSNAASAVPSSSNAGGGGLYIHGGTAHLWASQILDNAGDASHLGTGGGIYLSYLTHAEVLSNVIHGNEANHSGGLYVESGSAVYVAGNRIEGNQAQANGGGVYVTHSDVHLTRNSIISNTAYNGGGISIESSTPVTLSNNLMARNEASCHGGGAYVGLGLPPGSHAILVNNTIADNGDRGVVAWMHAALTMTNNLIAGHTTGFITTVPASATVSADTNLFWNTNDPITGSNGIREDPLLAADYHLGAGSPAVDAGLTVPWLTTDLEGTSRPQGSGYDIGAFEEVRWEVFLPLVLR